MANKKDEENQKTQENQKDLTGQKGLKEQKDLAGQKDLKEQKELTEQKELKEQEIQDSQEEQKGQGKKKKRRQLILILASLVAVPVLCLLAVYIRGVDYYKSHFLSGTIIDQVDASGLTVPQLTEWVQEYTLWVEERQADGRLLEEEIKGSEIGLSYSSEEPFWEILQNQNRFLWFVRQDTVQDTATLLTYDEGALEQRVAALRGFRKDFVVKPADAYISDYMPGSGFEIVKEVQGNQLNEGKTLETIRAAVEELQERVSLEEEDCYEVPGITSADDALQAFFQSLQSYANINITYHFGEEEEVLDGETIVGWLTIDGQKVAVDEERVAEYVASLRKRYDTIFRKRVFHTSYGIDVPIEKGDYGWWMDTEQEIEKLSAMIAQGESGERSPVYHQTAAAYGTPDYGSTYVEINLTAQHLFLYIDGDMVLESDFVSGNASRGYNTPAGIYGITYKQRDATLVGENYRTPVSYWMPFNNNVGMHDATWRNAFGGDIYMTNGSHGCINLPYSVAQEIYGYVEKGTPVICYYLPGTEPVPAEEVPAEPGVEGQETASAPGAAGQGTAPAPDAEGQAAEAMPE